ncbi:MAG: Eco57I restriction-modification methylase domain-containing protein [Rhodocyclaceae bacterium]|jgi:site-specific DNA-methyltransferase (adenine-specific)|nr:Eco57I restriction-modification methylase domain-containing protein [Rhodocyclaceae bacterium]MCA3146135.1 Eco57I restriction-modification methylase domain-containing protein [Rhodocyclaceae bacterium]
MEQAAFTLRGRNPDVLTCIANLSNDEVFTPPEFANRMLDTVAQAWAADHGGANLWADKSVRFLDPCTKSGVFLREITRRLVTGLAGEIPDLEERVEHILTRQVYGIAITHLTSLLARRSLYCSKHAQGRHSIARSFQHDAGNIWFERLEHTWNETKCQFCGAPRAILARNKDIENYAYAFIHTDNVAEHVAKMFGGNMQFDVIVGNPPYQMKGGAGGTSDSSIYHLFVEQAIRLEPRYLSMVIPSRWLAGGRGMDDFRNTMLTDRHISHLVDYTKMSTAFPGVDFEGGVGYFLWGREYQGEAQYTLFQGEHRQPTIRRDLGAQDTFVRDHRALGILERVQRFREPTMDQVISGDTPFGLPTNFSDFKDSAFPDSVSLYRTERGRRLVVHTRRTNIKKNTHLIDAWKVLFPEAYGERGAIPALVLGPSIVAPPGSVCTQTYLLAGPLVTREQAVSLQRYSKSRFFRFLVSLRKITQHALRSTYSWVPQQSWDRDWTDELLFEKYGINGDEKGFIESMIRPMAEGDE